MAQILKYNLGGQTQQPNIPSIKINGKSYVLDDDFKQGVYDYIDTFDEDMQYYMKSLFNLYTNGTSIDTHTNTIAGIDLNQLNISDHKKRKLGKHQSNIGAVFNSEDMNNWKRATVHLANYNPDKLTEDSVKDEETTDKKPFTLSQITLGDTASIRNISDLNILRDNLNNLSNFEMPDNLSYINSNTVDRYIEILDKYLSGTSLTAQEKNNLKDLNINFTSSITSDTSSEVVTQDRDNIRNSPQSYWDGDTWVTRAGQRINMAWEAQTNLTEDTTGQLSSILPGKDPWHILSNGDKIYKTKDNNRIVWFHDGTYYYKIVQNKNGGRITKFKSGGSTAIGQFFEDLNINWKTMLPHALGIVDHGMATFGNNKIEGIEKAIAKTTLSGTPVKPTVVYPIFSTNDYIAGQHALNKLRNTNLNLSSDARLNLGHVAANSSKVHDAEVTLNNNLSNAYSNYRNSWLETKQKDNELSAQTENAARQIAVNAKAQMLQAEGKRIHNNISSGQELVRKWITDLEKDAAKMDQLKQRMYISNASDLISTKMSTEAAQKYPAQTDPLVYWKTEDPQGFLQRQMEIFDELNYTDMPQTSIFSTWWK